MQNTTTELFQLIVFDYRNGYDKINFTILKQLNCKSKNFVKEITKHIVAYRNLMETIFCFINYKLSTSL